MSPTRLAALALAATTLAASGCGGSSKTTSTSTAAATTAPSSTGSTSTTTAATTAQHGKALTKAQLIAKADAVCKRIEVRLHAQGAKTVSDVVRLAPQLAAYHQARAAELDRVTPPASLEADWKQIVAAMHTAAEDTVKFGEYTKANNAAGTQELQAAAIRLHQQTLAIAMRDGITKCALAF